MAHYQFLKYVCKIDRSIVRLLFDDALQTATGGETIFHTNPPPVELIAYRAVTLGNDTR